MRENSKRKTIDDLSEYVPNGPKRREFVAALGASVGATVAGCSGTGTQPTTQDGTATTGDQTPTSGGSGEKKRLIVAIGSSLKNLDPTQVSADVPFHILENVQERLFNITPELEIETELATDLEVSNGGKTWTMPIRKGVTFHPPTERELVADDVVKTFEWVSNPDNNSPYASYFSNVTDITAQGDYTVQLELERPVVDLKIFLAKPGAGIWPMEARENGDLSNHPVGTGPFVFEEWVPDSHLTLVRNENYWEDGVPHLERVEYRPIPKSEVRLTSLQTGDVEYGIPPTTALDAVKNDERLTLSTVDTPAFAEVKVNCTTQWRKDNPFAASNGGVKARQAVAEAMDYPSIVQAASNGVNTKTQNPFPKQSPWHVDYAPYSWEANPQKAKRLLEEAGVGTDLTINMRSNNVYSGHQAIAKVVQANLRQVGVEAKLKLSDWATEVDIEVNGQYDLAVNSWPGWLSPDAYLYTLFHTKGSFNNMEYENERVDQLLEAGKGEFDHEKRKQLYREAQKIIVDECPYIWVYHRPSLKAWESSLEGVHNHPYSYAGWNWKTARER